jgi:enoyl-CoA hydratase
MQSQSFADGALTLHGAPVARLVLNAPQRRNAMSQAMWAGLVQACDAVEANPAIRVLILTGAGDHFCAGADISEFEAVSRAATRTAAYNRLVRSGQARLRNVAVPVLAMIRGACVGGGCGLALSADLRFAAADARLGITPSRLGLAYSPEDTAQLIGQVGAARARDLLFSGRLVEGAEAKEIGLVDFLRPGDQLEAEVAAYAEELCQRSRASVLAAKRIINGLTDPDETRRQGLQDAYEQTFAGPDFAEGRAAFLAKRPPMFP